MKTQNLLRQLLVLSCLVLSFNLTFGQQYFKTEIYLDNQTSDTYVISGNIFNGSTYTWYIFTVPGNTKHTENFINLTPHWVQDLRVTHSPYHQIVANHTGLYPTPTDYVYYSSSPFQAIVDQLPYTYGQGNYYQFYTIHL